MFFPPFDGNYFVGFAWMKTGKNMERAWRKDWRETGDSMEEPRKYAGGFLEGVYGVWLKSAGAPDELVLEQVEGPQLPMYMAFVLSGRA